jgi:cell division septum initiation protein DivIVA
MADIDEAEAMVRGHQGIENDEVGRLIVRLVREIRGLRTAVQDLRARVTALEARVP